MTIKKMNKFLILFVLLLSVLVAGCSKRPQSVSGSYISPLAYQHYSCDQITLEMQRVANKVAEVTGVQRSKATSDAVATGVGVVIFWPALFFLMGSDKEQELARLKGESETLEQIAIQKNCHQLIQQIERERKELEE